jgi:hypothetical protein
MKFKVGDEVQWTSQSQGYARPKKGIVAEVIAPGQRPDRDLYPSLYKGAGCGLSRKSVSYVINVTRINGRVPKYYWPRANLLRELRVCNVTRPLPSLPQPVTRDQAVEQCLSEIAVEDVRPSIKSAWKALDRYVKPDSKAKAFSALSIVMVEAWKSGYKAERLP